MSWSQPVELPPPPPPRGLGDVLAGAFRLYGRWWRALVPIVAVVTVPLTLLQEWVVEELVPRVPPEELQRLDPEEVGARALGALLVTVAFFLASVALQGALVFASARSVVGWGTGLAEAYRVGLSRLGALLLAGLLAGLAVLVGFVLLVVPGFVVLVRLSLFAPALIVERLRARRALARSWDLVRGRSWAVLGALVVGGLVAMAVGALLGAIAALVSTSWVVLALVSGLASALTTPITTLIVVLLYVDQRQRKEGLTLAALEAELGALAVRAPGAVGGVGPAP